MQERPSKPLSRPVREDGKPLVATFKTSLRAWQAIYRARLATLAAEKEKTDQQAVARSKGSEPPK